MRLQETTRVNKFVSGDGSGVDSDTVTKTPRKQGRTRNVLASTEGRTSDVLVVKGKGGRPPIVVSEEAKKKVLHGVRLGIPIERLRVIAIPSNSPGAWENFLRLNPSFAEQLEAAKGEGELELASRVHSSEVGWQGAAWLLERARGYVARASLEHTGKGGSALTIAHQVLTAVGEKEK